MKITVSTIRKAVLIFLAVMLLTGSLSLPQAATSTSQALAVFPDFAAPLTDNPQDGTLVMLPILLKKPYWENPFGAEIGARMSSTSSILYTRSMGLPISWMRLNERISWRDLQPNEGDPINWALLAVFEAELRTLASARITPVVVVDDYPRWATDNTVRSDGYPTSCGPLLPSRIDDFAVFVQALVARYSVAPYNVHIWELGNEPDVDPDLVYPDSDFGCWGDKDDTYYGGGRYGYMLQAVTPAIKAIDPSAQVWIGGLLLARPVPINPSVDGHPELFLQGILESGAANSFDAVAYHAYSGYNGKREDQDAGEWGTWGGYLVGKARFLRQIMAPYGVDKPLYIDETGLNCNWCTLPLQDRYLQMQADFLVRSFARAVSEDISGIMWYTLDGHGWHYSGLLDDTQSPKLVYTAYQHLITRLTYTEPLGPVTDYGSTVEAYGFVHRAIQTDIVYARDDLVVPIAIPKDKFIVAYTRDGAVIQPTYIDANIFFYVSFEPIYLVHYR